MTRYLVAATMGLLFASPALAETRIFDFIARVDQPDVFVPAGTFITGRFSYDDVLAPTELYATPESDTAIYDNPSVILTVAFNGLNLSSNAIARVTDFHLPVGPSFPDDGDVFLLGNYSAQEYYELALWQPDRAWLTDTSLPGAFPVDLWQGPFADPNDDDSVTIPHGEFFFFDRVQQSGFSALVISVTPASMSAVPEPASWAMMIAGFGVAGAAMRRRRAVIAFA
jgi:hypothetical protein